MNFHFGINLPFRFYGTFYCVFFVFVVVEENWKVFFTELGNQFTTEDCRITIVTRTVKLSPVTSQLGCSRITAFI